MDMVSVILPTYNECEAVVLHIQKISEVLQKLSYDYEIVVVDDNSPDGTAVAVKELSQKNPHVRLVLRIKDRGLGLSIGEGIRDAKGNIIVGMDADGNHDPLDLPNLLANLSSNTKLVVASRYVGRGGMSGWRTIPTLLFNTMFRLLGSPIWDNTSGYYVVRREDLMALGLAKIYYGYGDYHLRLLHYAQKAGWIIREVPTRYQPRIGGVSKSRLIKMAIDYTKEAWRLRQLR